MTKAAAPSETKSGIELNIGQALSTGTIGGKAFEAIPGGDVAIYTTEPFEQKTAEEAAPASAADIDIDVRKDSKGVAAHGVKIELNPEGVPVITLEKGKTLSVEPAFSAETPATETDGVALSVNENRIRVTLPGDKVFDITPDGNATTYNDNVQRKTTDATPLNAEEYQRVTIGNDFNAVAMNSSSVELTNGALAIATDGISEAKKPAAVDEAPANDANIASETKTKFKIGEPVPAKNGWIYGGKSPTTRRDFFIAPKDSGMLPYDDAEKAAKEFRKLGMVDVRVPSRRELKVMSRKESLIGGFNQHSRTYNGYDCRYWSSSTWLLPGQKVTRGFGNVDKVQSSGYKKEPHATRLVCS